MTNTQHDRMPNVVEVCADEAQMLALSITRFLAAGYMTQDVACWDAGCQCAEEVLGPGTAPCLVATMIGLMRALRAERKHPWQFMPATCCRVTRDEISLLSALDHAQGPDQGGLAAATRVLTGLDEAPRLTAALKAAAEMLESVRPMLAGSHSPQAQTPFTRH
jgi:hypothetical protein